MNITSYINTPTQSAADIRRLQILFKVMDYGWDQNVDSVIANTKKIEEALFPQK